MADGPVDPELQAGQGRRGGQVQGTARLLKGKEPFQDGRKKVPQMVEECMQRPTWETPLREGKQGLAVVEAIWKAWLYARILLMKAGVLSRSSKS
jgi:hypothetical protein